MAQVLPATTPRVACNAVGATRTVLSGRVSIFGASLDINGESYHRRAKVLMSSAGFPGRGTFCKRIAPREAGRSAPWEALRQRGRGSLL